MATRVPSLPTEASATSTPPAVSDALDAVVGSLALEDAGEPPLLAAGESAAAPGAAAPAGTPPPAGAPGAPIVATPKWTPQEAALLLSGGIDAAGLPLYRGDVKAYEADWRVKDDEVDPWAASAARLLDRTPVAPGAAGLAGVIADGLIVFGGLMGVTMPRLQTASKRIADRKATRAAGAAAKGEGGRRKGTAAPSGAPRPPETGGVDPRTMPATPATAIPAELFAAAGVVDGDQFRRGDNL